MTEQTTTTPSSSPSPSFPRISITYCTKCKWMLRAAYLAQELLSTFSTSLGEVALVPGSENEGGVFRVDITTSIDKREGEGGNSKEAKVLWDRTVDGGFPETKELKARVRNVIDPGRDLGHVDRALKKQKGGVEEEEGVVKEKEGVVKKQEEGKGVCVGEECG